MTTTTLATDARFHAITGHVNPRTVWVLSDHGLWETPGRTFHGYGFDDDVMVPCQGEWVTRDCLRPSALIGSTYTTWTCGADCPQ